MVPEHLRLDFLRVLDLECAVGTLQHAAVAGLAAGFGVKRRVIEHHHADFAFA